MLIDQTRIGRYEVVSALGHGAMGAVYKAVDPLIERDVAIKTISLNLSKAERAEFEERFYREAKSAGRLSHANIVTIYDVGETDDIAYIAMEYVEGKSLRELLDSGVVLPTEMISRIVARIANALHYAHENHVVHRDIKPANIMITSNRDVKIMDFGIAQIPTGSRTQLGTVLGSPKYMAPEQVVGQPTDGRTDIFALGVVLYEMLTGTTPFNGDNLSAIMYQVLHEEPAPPSVINPRVPPGFDRITARALAKRPEDRYQTALAFAQDLDCGAAPPHDARQADPGVQPVKKTQPSRKTEEQEATLFLPPRRARGVVPKRIAGTFGERTAALLQEARHGRKPLLLAISLLLVVAFMLYSHDPQPEMAGLGTKPDGLPDKAMREAASAESGRPRAGRAKATVWFALAPWGEVYVDGKKAGVSPPLTEVQLAPGRHKLEIRNRGFAPYRRTVNLKAGQSLKIRHNFE